MGTPIGSRNRVILDKTGQKRADVLITLSLGKTLH
jgi:hypothetical protein